jgi:AraC-like DNA-binding protein
MDKVPFRMYFLNTMKVTEETSRQHYLAVSEQDEAWGLHASGAGYARIAPNESYPPRNHPAGYAFSWEKGRALQEYALIYITHGKGLFESATAKKKLAGGDLLILRPGQWHRYRPDPETGWHEYWICFNGSIADQLFAQNPFPTDPPVLSIGYNEQITRMFVQAQELAGEMPRAFQARIAAHIMHILALAQAARQPGSSDDDELVRRIRCALTEHMEQNIRMEDVAASLHVGYAKFRRAFKAHTGLTPGQYHLQLRIGRAKDLLTGTDLPVQQIALQLGFDSPFYFSRIFKKKTDHAPQEWRSLTAPS